MVELAHNLDKNIAWLTGHLKDALESPFYGFDQIGKFSARELYFIFDDRELLYVGMTDLEIKIRLREMTRDYRSHTFNSKLLLNHLTAKGIKLDRLRLNIKRELNEMELLSVEQFKEL